MQQKRTVDVLQDSLETGRQGHSITWQTETTRCHECQEQFKATVVLIDGQVRHVQELCPACNAAVIHEERKAEALVKMAEVSQSQFEKWQIEANCPRKFKGRTFDNFDKKLQPRAFRVLSSWQPSNSVVLSSANIYGVGKTHLVCALLHKILAATTPAWLTGDLCIQSRRCPVHFTAEPHLLDSIRATYNAGATETDDLIYRRLASYDVLILDDVGKTRPRDLSFLQGVYYRIIDERYSANHPVILTTNLSLPELESHIGGSCADRLTEMCGTQNIVEMKGKSYRTQKCGSTAA